MELFLIRFLCGATLLLVAGLLGASVLQRRGPAASCIVLRATLAGLVLCVIAATLPAPVRPITTIATPEAKADVLPTLEETPVQLIEVPAPVAVEEGPTVSTLPTVTEEPEGKSLPWQTIALGIWAVGALIGLGRLLFGHFLLLRLRRGSQPVDLRLDEVYPLELRETSVISTPLLAGCARSVLYLPQSGLLRESQEALKMMLAHELAHHKRRDLAWSLVAQLLRAILWLHPLIHLVAHRQELLSEQAADEVALRQLPQRQAYARLLLTLSELAEPRPPVFTMCMASGQSRVGKRIKHLLSTPLSVPLSLNGRIGIAVATLTMLVAGTALIGYAKKPPIPTAVLPERRIIRSDVRSAVNLSVTNRPLREVIAEVSRLSKYTIEVDTRLSGNISIAVKGKDCDEVLRRICPQIKPAAWFSRVNIGKDKGADYVITPLPPVGKIVGQVVSTSGKPIAGVQIYGLDLIITTDTQGGFTLPRIAKRPYEITFRPPFESGFAQKTIQVSGVPGQTVTIPNVQLQKGARIDLQYSDNFRHGSLYAETSAMPRVGAVMDNTVALRVAAGESRFVPSKRIVNYRVVSHSGAGKWQINNGALLVSLKEGEYARFVIDAKLTPEMERSAAAQKRFLQERREASKRESALMKRKMARVKLDTQPQAFLDAVKKLCQQAAQSKVAIEPGIGGIVKAPEHHGTFERTLKELCLQANPVAFPIWEGDLLHIVRAPERGKFDKKTHLYRLAGLNKEAVFQELPGHFHSGGGGEISWRNSPREEKASVTVTDYMTQKPLPGIVLIHETPGKIRQIRTDAQGRCQLDFIPGPNYYYLQPNKQWFQYASRSRGGPEGSVVNLELMRQSDRLNKRENDWGKLITFQVNQMPAKQALRKLFRLIGEENIALPDNLTGKVTVDARNERFSRVFAKVSRQVTPYLIPELRQKITVKPFPH